MTQYATYIRVSTDQQQTGENSQRDAIQEYLDANNITVKPEDQYADINYSGADETRTEFNQLLKAVENRQYTDIVMPEISRLARKTSTSALFIDECVEKGVTIHLLDDMIDTISPDNPMSQFFGKMLSLWMEEERKQTIRRIKRGVRQAQQQGKWTGRPPVGFTTTTDGYLTLKLEEYLAFQNALERIDNGDSYRSVAKDTRWSRTALRNKYTDEQQRQIYLEETVDLDTNSNPEEQRKHKQIANAIKQLQ